MRKSPRPTHGELAILRVLWRCGPCTVRQVHGALAGTRDRAVGYTTVLKLLQIMTEKGLVARDATSRSHVYSARVGEAATEKRLVADLVERVFGGSALRLVQQALASKHLTPRELQAVRRLLDEHDGG